MQKVQIYYGFVLLLAFMVTLVGSDPGIACPSKVTVEFRNNLGDCLEVTLDNKAGTTISRTICELTSSEELSPGTYHIHLNPKGKDVSLMDSDITIGCEAPTIYLPPIPAPEESMKFIVTIPANTPPEENIYLASLNACFPMIKIDSSHWTVSLSKQMIELGTAWYNDGSKILGYAYSHGYRYMGGEFFSDNPENNEWQKHREVTFIANTVQVDAVTRWRYFPPAGETLPTLSATLLPFLPRLSGMEFQAGIEIADYWPGWDGYYLMQSTSEAIRNANAQWVEIAPPGGCTQLDPLPVIANILGYDDQALHAHIANSKKNRLKVLLAPQLTGLWNTSLRSVEWWDGWFKQFGNFLEYYARIAQETGVDALLLDWAPFALPGAEGAPADAVQRWTQLVAGIRKIYHGPIGFPLSIGWSVSENYQPWPWANVRPISHLFDFLGMGLVHGLSDNSSPTQAELDANVEKSFSASLDPVYAETMLPAVIIGIGYRSHKGGAINDRGVEDPLIGSIAFGPEKFPIPYDGIEQAMIFQAIMEAVARRPHIIGVYPFNYNWTSIPLAIDYSIRGKAAEKLLSQWYGYINNSRRFWMNPTYITRSR